MIIALPLSNMFRKIIQKSQRLENTVPGISVLFIVTFLAGGCASSLSVEMQPPYTTAVQSNEEGKRHAHTVLKEIEDRNRTVENHPEWIQESYGDFMIKRLSDIDEQAYADYRKYLDNGSVYVIVHPAYYPFFSRDRSPDRTYRISKLNTVDRYLAGSSLSSKSMLLKAQEKFLRDFLEYMSTEKKLVILILPGDYRAYLYSHDANGRDEYMRYINEVTNSSDSVLYLYSRKRTQGALNDEDRTTLISFLYHVRADSVLLGGSYFGRCLADLHEDLERYYSKNKVYVVPEITSISPSDLGSVPSDIVRSDGTVNVTALSRSVSIYITENQAGGLRLRNLSHGPLK